MKYTFDHFKNYYGDHWQRRKGQIRHITDLNKGTSRTVKIDFWLSETLNKSMGRSTCLRESLWVLPVLVFTEDALEYLTMIKQKMNEEKASSGQNGTAVSPIKFALTVSFYATHGWDGKLFPDQYCPMNYSEPLYDGMTIPTAKTATEEEWEKMPWFFTEENEGRKRWRLRFDTPDHYQVSMKRLMRMASEADDVVGAVVQELKDMGVYDNTLLVFTTDNGNFHGGTCGLTNDPSWERKASCLFRLICTRLF
jgi:arylsulfatase A-like enzyme